MTSLIISTPHKVGQQLLADDCQDGFRMKLNSFDRIRSMTQSHDDSVCGMSAHFQTWRNVRDDQRMITGRGKVLGNSTKNGFAIVNDRAGFSMHQRWSADYFAAEYFTDSLVSQANTQNGNR